MILIERDDDTPYIVFQGESAEHIESCSNFLSGLGFRLATIDPILHDHGGPYEKTFYIWGKGDTKLIPESFALFTVMIGAGDVMYFNPAWKDSREDEEVYQRSIKLNKYVFVSNIRRYEDEKQYQES